MKIVSEYLEKYWPNKKPPKIFYRWLKYAINNNSFKEIMVMFRLNKTLKKSFFKIKILKCVFKKIMNLE
jgi:alpha-1,3-rhamnosyltransferase